MIIGLYAFAPSEQSEKKSGNISNMLRKIFRAQSKDKVTVETSEIDEKERLFSQLCSKTKVNKCKEGRRGGREGGRDGATVRERTRNRKKLLRHPEHPRAGHPDPD